MGNGEIKCFGSKNCWDQGWVCLIAGRIYSCVAQHNVVSYHAGILPIDSVFLTFILSHQSGLMKSVFNDIIRFRMV